MLDRPYVSHSARTTDNDNPDRTGLNNDKKDNPSPEKVVLLDQFLLFPQARDDKLQRRQYSPPSDTRHLLQAPLDHRRG